MLAYIDWALLSIIVLLAGIVRGCIGFGFSALVVSTGVLFLAPLTVVPMVAVLEIIASVQMAMSTWRKVAVKPLLWLLVGAAVATPLGVFALVLLPADIIRLILSAMIFVMSLLLLSGWQYQGKVSNSSYIAMGVFSGVCNGAAAVGGLPVATFLASVRLSMPVLRATLVMFFFAADIIFILSASGHAIYNMSLIVLSTVMVLPMLIGIHIGSRVFDKLNEKTLRRAVIVLLLALSTFGLVKGFTNSLIF